MQDKNDKYSFDSTVVEEAFRVLRSNIQFCGVNHEIKSLTIVSCNPGEGKTTTAFNLAVSMAKVGKKVLLVDADLRKSQIEKHIGNQNTLGLSNLISGFATLEEVINVTNLSGFNYIHCGQKPPNPTELISSQGFSDFLETVTQRFDMVIVDTPPLGGIIDSALIASKTDGTLLVIQSRSIDYRVVQRVKDQLEKANARILGVVLSRVSRNDYKDYYNYYKYYQKGNKRKKEMNDGHIVSDLNIKKITT